MNGFVKGLFFYPFILYHGAFHTRIDMIERRKSKVIIVFYCILPGYKIGGKMLNEKRICLYFGLKRRNTSNE